MVQAFAADTAKKSLAERIHEWCFRGGSQDPDFRSLGDPIEVRTELVVVAGPGLVKMVIEERRPALPPGTGPSEPAHMLLDGPLGATRMPSFRSSPRMRSAPQSRFSAASHRIRSTFSGETRGGDASGGLDRARQKSLKPSRCQRRIVSGFITRSASRHRGTRRARITRRPRSQLVNLGLLTVRAATMSCLPQARVLSDELLPRADHVPEQPADHRDGTRDAARDRFHALCHPAREALNPSKESLRHDPHLQRTCGPVQVLRVADSYVILRRTRRVASSGVQVALQARSTDRGA
jgi:hypothetical protein